MSSNSLNLDIIKDSFIQSKKYRFNLLEEIITETEINNEKASELLHKALFRINLKETEIDFNRERRLFWHWLQKRRNSEVKKDTSPTAEVKEKRKTFTSGGFTFTDPEINEDKPKSTIRVPD